MFVGRDIGGAGQQRIRYGRIGGAVQHNGYALALGPRRHQAVDFHGNFQLQDDQVKLPDLLLQEGYVGRGDGHIGTGHHNNAVGSSRRGDLQLHIPHRRRRLWVPNNPEIIHAGSGSAA